MFIKKNYQMNEPEIITISAADIAVSSHEFDEHVDVLCVSNQTNATIDLYIQTKIDDHIAHDTLITLLEGQENAYTRTMCGGLKGNGPVYFKSTATQGQFVITTFRSKQ
jgi:hypothetical protein